MHSNHSWINKYLFWFSEYFHILRLVYLSKFDICAEINSKNDYSIFFFFFRIEILCVGVVCARLCRYRVCYSLKSENMRWTKFNELVEVAYYRHSS